MITPVKDVGEYASRLSPETLQSIASLQLEGIAVSKEMLDDLVLRDAGKITKEEFLKRAIERAKPQTQMKSSTSRG